MKKGTLVFLMAMGLIAGTVSTVWAGDACCAMKDGDKKAADHSTEGSADAQAATTTETTAKAE